MKWMAVRVLLIVLFSASVGLGLAWSQGRPLVPNLQQIEQEQTEHERWLAETGISLKELIAHYEVGSLVIDARSREAFEEGHLNAPLVMNIPAGEAQDGYHYDRVSAYIGLPVVVYCSSDLCEDAEDLWNVLQSWGFSHEVRVFHAGWAGMVAAGLPATTGPDPYGYPADEYTDDGSISPDESEWDETGDEMGDEPLDEIPDDSGGG
ncbi:MAG: rhodanese-like domain-containing protein [Phycisphaerae bacterium]|jgi:hypothetical protein